MCSGQQSKGSSYRHQSKGWEWNQWGGTEIISRQLHPWKNQYWGLCLSAGMCRWRHHGFRSVGMCFLRVFFFFSLNHSCWCENQVGSVKANSCYILGRQGGKCVVCLEFGSSLMLFMAAKCCSCSGGFVPLHWHFNRVFFFSHTQFFYCHQNVLLGPAVQRVSLLKNADNKNAGNATS